MATGYWIVKGDKTSCGGSVLEGHPKGGKFGSNLNQQAVSGNKVSCGKHSGTYIIAGGHPGEVIHGCLAASTLYSRSTCPCNAFFIPTHTWAVHGPYQGGKAQATPAAKAEEPTQYAQTAKKPSSYLTGEKQDSEFVPDYPVLRNTHDLPDQKVRDLLRANNHDVMLLTMEEAYEVLADWGTYTKGWTEITQSTPGTIAVNYGTNIKDVVTTSKLIVDLGGFGIKATTYINRNGTELIKLTGYPGIRKVLNAPVFAAKNMKVVDLGIGKYGLSNSIIEGARLTFYVSAAFRVLDFILNDETSLAEFIGSLATDVAKIGLASVISWGVGTVVMAFTASVTVPIIISVLAGFGAVYVLGELDKKFGVTDKLVELIEAAQQEIVSKALEAQDGFVDILEMKVSNLLDKGVEFTGYELKKYIKNTISELLKEEW